MISVSDAYRPVSLDVPVTDEDGAETLGDLIGDEDPELETVHVSRLIRRSLAGLRAKLLVTAPPRRPVRPSAPHDELMCA